MDMLNLSKDCSSHHSKEPVSERKWVDGHVGVSEWVCVCGGREGCVNKVKYLTFPYIYFSLALYSARVVCNTASEFLFPSAPVISHWFSPPFPLQDRSPLQMWVFNEAQRSAVLSTSSVFSESTKYIFVSLVSIKGKNPPVLPSEKFFWSDCSQNESWGELFFFFFVSWVVWSTLWLSWKQNWELKDSTLEGKKRRRRRRCFSSFCKSEAKIWPFIFLVIADNTW